MSQELLDRLDALGIPAEQHPMPWHYGEDGEAMEPDCFLAELDDPDVRAFVVGLVSEWTTIRTHLARSSHWCHEAGVQNALAERLASLAADAHLPCRPSIDNDCSWQLNSDDNRVDCPNCKLRKFVSDPEIWKVLERSNPTAAGTSGTPCCHHDSSDGSVQLNSHTHGNPNAGGPAPAFINQPEES